MLCEFGCGKGISPEPEQVKQQSGFGGTITFKGKWPDSVKYTRLIVFINPLAADSDFSINNLGFLSDAIPNNTESVIYNSSVNPLVPIKPGKYSYIAVVQSKTLLLPKRELWTVAGVYYNNGDTTKPGILNLHEGQFINDVNIICDFNNPPTQPPE
jgi:hypothetical protein